MDENGLEYRFAYDAIGREVWRSLPDGTATTTAYWDCENASPLPIVCADSSSPLAVNVQAEGQGWATTFFDSRGQAVAMRESGTGGAVLSATTYDALGRPRAVTRPHFDGASAPAPTSIEYDDLDRVKRVVAPDGLETLVEFGFESRRHKQTTTTKNSEPGAGRWRTERFDAAGRIVGVVESPNGVEQEVTIYGYGPFGENTVIADPQNHLYLRDFDKWGRLRSITEPDRGHWEFDHDALGNLIWRRDAKGNEVLIAYDRLNRPTARVEPEGNTSWEYGLAPGAVGLLFHVAGPGYERTYHYDSLARPYWQEAEIFGHRFGTLRTFDSLGRLDRLDYPSGEAVRSLYAPTGELERIEHAATSELIWEAQAIDALDRVRVAEIGSGGVTIGRDYQPDSELISEISIDQGAAPVAGYAYDFDGFRELRTRSSGSRSETFEHDGLGRITSSQVQSEPEVTYEYDAIGNLTARSDQPAFAGLYGTAPHRLTAVGANVYSYDANGCLVFDGTQSVDWTSFGLPSQVSTPSYTDLYSYGPNRERIRRASTSSGETLYVDDLYEAQVVGGEIIGERSWIAVPGEVKLLISKSGGVTEQMYQVSDHLGSATLLMDELGTVLEELSYSPFGDLRNPDWSPAAAGQSPASMSDWDQFFTGQRLEAGSGYYDFNARFLSPAVGRFLSPDPILAPVGVPQLLNPYSYVVNNPLHLVDPTGLFSEAFDDGGFGDDGFGSLWDELLWQEADTARRVQEANSIDLYSLGDLTGIDATGFDTPGLVFVETTGVDLFEDLLGGSGSNGFLDYESLIFDDPDLLYASEGGGGDFRQGQALGATQNASRLDSGSFVYGFTGSANAVASGIGAREESFSYGRVLGNDTGFTGQRDILIRTSLSEPAVVFGRPAAGGLDVGVDATFFGFVGTPRELTRSMVSDASLVGIELRVFMVEGGGIFSGIRGFSIGLGLGLGASSIDGSAVPTTVRITDVAHPLARP